MGSKRLFSPTPLGVGPGRHYDLVYGFHDFMSFPSSGLLLGYAFGWISACPGCCQLMSLLHPAGIAVRATRIRWFRACSARLVSNAGRQLLSVLGGRSPLPWTQAPSQIGIGHGVHVLSTPGVVGNGEEWPRSKNALVQLLRQLLDAFGDSESRIDRHVPCFNDMDSL